MPKELASRFSRPSARVRYGRSLVGIASAAIDISDGLYADLGKLLASSGVGGEIDLGALPLSRALQENFAAQQQLDFALTGGDDYELCFTSACEPPDPGFMPLTAIGKVVDGEGLTCTADGKVVDFDDPGFLHFQ